MKRYLLALKKSEHQVLLKALKDYRLMNQESLNREEQNKIQTLEQRLKGSERLSDNENFAYDVSTGRWLMQRKSKPRQVGQIIRELGFIRRADPIANLVRWLIESGTTTDQLNYALRGHHKAPIVVELLDKFQSVNQGLPTTNQYGFTKKWG